MKGVSELRPHSAVSLLTPLKSFAPESLSVLVWPLFGSVALTLETVSKVTKTGKYSGGFGLKRSVLPPPGVGGG